MQSQRIAQLPHLVAHHDEGSDVLMTSPFSGVHNTFDKECAGGSLLSNILQGDNCDDWTDMDCDDEDMATSEHLLQHHHRLVRGEDGMKSRDSTGSMDSASSTSSTQEYEPELSQSFGSATSYDLRTPIKPPTSLPSQPLQHMSFAKTEQGYRSTAPSSLLTSLSTSPRSISSEHTVAAPNNDTKVLLAQKRHNLGELLGMQVSDARSGAASETKSKRPAAPGLAGRLKINLPPASSSSSFDASSVPHTPGGHIATGARDGAATGGAPISPFEPPTPLYAPTDSAFARAAAAAVSPVTPPSSALRPKILQRHTSTPLRHNSSNMLGMSPITSQFAAVSMRKASSSKGSTSHEDGSETCASPTMLLTPPYSPFATSKALPAELEIPTTPLQRKSSASSTGSNSSSSGGGKKTQTRGSDVVRSAVSPSSRQKAVKAKVSPYTLSREGSPGKTNSPSDSSANAKVMSQSDASPSLLRDVVKLPVAAPPMDRCTSEPMPKTVSARHLAHRTLHPVFSANYTLGDELGSGGFGFVVSATRNRDGMPVAVKFIFKDKVPTHGWVRDDVFGAIPMEAFVLKVVDNPFVVKFVDLFDDDQFFYLVMEHHGTPWKAPSGQDKPTKKSGSSKAASVVSPLNPLDEAKVAEKADKLALLASTPMRAAQSQPHAAPVPSPTVAVFPPESDVAMESTPPLVSPGSTSYASSASSSSDGLAKPAPRPAPMQRQSSCDLFECIEQHSRLSEDKARWVFAQIVEAVYYLDKRGICHRDIKDENCVIDSDFNVKLIDFGSAVITDPRRPTPYFNRFFGTMTFASSEILQGKQYRAPHAEVWSLGVLLSILLSGECPFADPTAAIRGKISRPNGSWSSDALNLLMACLVVNPDKRATIAQIRQHPWVVKAWKQRGQTRPGDDDVSPSTTSP